MRDKEVTREFYLNTLGFKQIGDYEGYLMVQKETTYDKKVMFLFEYSSIQKMNLLHSYVFPDSYSKANMLSFYKNEIYITGDKLVLK